ncbi:Hypothetical predicted protein [Mytilus galloprovincialis]|uniref:Uncharacterized protein n=1 Tax=Mytilus galloprovincialis TaxID=29158 RepID=A0A8B6E6X9_MYTGA|nr:Hypothetical predicted protein [Mytilus galloprovincialis]
MGTSASSTQGDDIDSIIQALNYSVVCGIEIKNSTQYVLHSPKTTVEWGYLLSPPPTSIKPEEKGSFIGHKNSASATGTTGVVSYMIGTTKLRMVVMWASPYNFDFYENYLAVGFDVNHDKEIYNLMYYGEGRDYQFSRDSYYRNCNAVQKTKDCFTIHGIMGTSHKSKVVIELYEEKDPNASKEQK